MTNKTCFPLYGIVTVLNTPFTLDDHIDLKALRQNVRNALSAGVGGFLVPALAAEVNQLTGKEKINMVEAVCEEVNKKVPVFAATGPVPLPDAKKLIRAYLSLGCRQVLFQIPYESDEQFSHHFNTLAEMDIETIMLQDWSATGYGLTDELILTLFDQVPQFRCLKVETTPAGAKYTRLLELTEGKLNLSGGWAVTQLIEGLERGVHAFMPTGMHWAYTEIFNAWVIGDFTKAHSLFRRILPILAFSNQHLDISIHFFKRLLHRQGTYNTDKVRKLDVSFDSIHRRIADGWIDEVIALEESIIRDRMLGQ
jgi:dihydrodipicolinate synthase/N-acetylneuraminate lyase